MSYPVTPGVSSRGRCHHVHLGNCKVECKVTETLELCWQCYLSSAELVDLEFVQRQRAEEWCRLHNS